VRRGVGLTAIALAIGAFPACSLVTSFDGFGGASADATAMDVDVDAGTGEVVAPPFDAAAEEEAAAEADADASSTVDLDSGLPRDAGSDSAEDAESSVDSCGNACPTGATCEGGRCIATIASNQSGAFDLTLDAAHVYWTTKTASGSVMQAALDRSGLVTLASNRNFPWGIAVVSARGQVAWADNGGGTIDLVPIDGGNITLVVNGESSPTDLASDGTHLFWCNQGSSDVVRATPPFPNGAIDVIATNQQAPCGIVAQGNQVYWGTNDGNVMRCGAGGCNLTPIPLATSQNGPTSVTADANNVYWTNAGGTVMQCAIGGCNNSPTTLASGLGSPSGIAVDSASVYFADKGAGNVSKVPVGGGPVTTIASGLASPMGVAVSATSVFWTDSAAGTVMSATPK
jgi:hypothetical protein